MAAAVQACEQEALLSPPTSLESLAMHPVLKEALFANWELIVSNLPFEDVLQRFMWVRTCFMISKIKS